MARNLAQLVFLAYCLWLLYRSNRILRSLLLVRMSERDLARNTRGLVNRAAFLRVKGKLPPLFWWMNCLAVSFFALDLVLCLVLGWFDFFSVPAKLFNALTALFCGAEAYTAALMDSYLRHDKLFILYNWDPDGDKIFSSGILDILLYVIGPVAIILANFLAL
ncbi:MAG: hypothetical protein J6Z79_03610 [Clostridia bacterium]|nr:hypothetical protein [Clostridia bacterium]